MRKKLAAIVIGFALFVSASAIPSFAQQKQSAPERERIEVEKTLERTPAPDRDMRFAIESEMQDPEGPGPGMPRDFVFLSTEMSFAGRLVKGAPYSADAITESLQILSDGNRIVNKTKAFVCRDSEGRTRREQFLIPISAVINGDVPRAIFISDPVAGTSYTLDPHTQIARKMPTMRFNFKVRVPGPGGEKLSGSPEPPPPDQPQRTEIERFAAAEKSSPDAHFVWGWGNHVAINEPLGKKNVEGVEAEGTRSKMTIPAGEIGNERPIEIVHEVWYSPELQAIVMTLHSDPRFGESSYRLTNIDRSEPARSLFEVPGNYTLKSGGPMPGENNGDVDTVTSFRPTGAIGGGILNGKAISLPRPAYPAIARAAQASGNVKVEVTIDEEGNVIAARAVSGHPLLQAASVAAARNAKFTPTKLSGQAVKVQGVLVYTFKSEEPPKDNN